MEVTETLSDGLKREFQIQVPAADLEQRVSQRLGELKDQVQLRGFRPGKVPVTHLKKIYGKRVMAETVDALIGMTMGEKRLVTITFPSAYAKSELAGKEAEFEVTAKSIEAPSTVTLDDDFAKSLGLDSLDKLKEAVRARLQQEHTAASRQRVKRQLLDKLDEMHKFALPPTLAEDEFKNVWSAVEGDLKSQGRTFADEGTTEEKAREEYRTIAERRVRLGLVLAEIGEKNNISVTETELTRAIAERARQVPGHEQQI